MTVGALGYDRRSFGCLGPCGTKRCAALRRACREHASDCVLRATVARILLVAIDCLELAGIRGTTQKLPRVGETLMRNILILAPCAGSVSRFGAKPRAHE